MQVQPEQVILARSTSRGNTLSRQSYDVKACNTHARARHRDPNSELALLGLETRDYHMVELIWKTTRMLTSIKILPVVYITGITGISQGIWYGNKIRRLPHHITTHSSRTPHHNTKCYSCCNTYHRYDPIILRVYLSDLLLMYSRCTAVTINPTLALRSYQIPGRFHIFRLSPPPSGWHEQVTSKANSKVCTVCIHDTIQQYHTAALQPVVFVRIIWSCLRSHDIRTGMYYTSTYQVHID